MHTSKCNPLHIQNDLETPDKRHFYLHLKKVMMTLILQRNVKKEDVFSIIKYL
jgi:hypothetical protein